MSSRHDVSMNSRTLACTLCSLVKFRFLTFLPILNLTSMKIQCWIRKNWSTLVSTLILFLTIFSLSRPLVEPALHVFVRCNQVLKSAGYIHLTLTSQYWTPCWCVQEIDKIVGIRMQAEIIITDKQQKSITVNRYMHCALWSSLLLSGAFQLGSSWI